MVKTFLVPHFIIYIPPKPRNSGITNHDYRHLTITKLFIPDIPITSTRSACSQDASVDACHAIYGCRMMRINKFCTKNEAPKSKKIKDRADMGIPNCWPELVILVHNCIFPLLFLSTGKPALTNIWQINM